MNTISDIVGLFARLPCDPARYQEIRRIQDAERAGDRWALVGEIFRAGNQPENKTGGQA
ncbi:MAG: BcsR/BcsP family cellulose biosynthesis protein [Pseudomonadota bacterium]